MNESKYNSKAIVLTAIIFAALAGGIIGLGSFTFLYGEGYSYLVDSPRACANCHIMRGVFDGWNHGSHKAVATCNDCHTPHYFPDKWIVKGINGWNHSLAFTMDNFKEPIRISARNYKVATENCLYCHGTLVSQIGKAESAHPTDCLTCHAGVGHGK